MSQRRAITSGVAPCGAGAETVWLSAVDVAAATARVARQPLTLPTRLNERWLMDFVADSLADRRWLRVLNILNEYWRECLQIEVDTLLPGARVVRTLEQ